MAKYPKIGEVKTRLAASVGDEAALRVYRALLANVVSQIVGVKDRSYSIGCFVTPVDMVDPFRSKYPCFDFYSSQADGDLGARMSAALSELVEVHGAKKAVLIGADIPQLSREHVQQAFAALDKSDVVWGPTDDGGYYLIGIKVVHRSLFHDIRWGTHGVLEQSVEAAEKSDLGVCLLESLSDLDDENDLRRFEAMIEFNF